MKTTTTANAGRGISKAELEVAAVDMARETGECIEDCLLVLQVQAVELSLKLGLVDAATAKRRLARLGAELIRREATA